MKVLFGIAFLSVMMSAVNAQDKNLTLWYDKPGEEWTQALP